MKKQRLLTLLSVACIASISNAQNSKIEIKELKTPTHWAQVNQAEGFNNPNLATTDLFSKNGCSTVGIPQNYMGNQESEDGNYFGIITFYGDVQDLLLNEIKGESPVLGKNKYGEYIATPIPSSLKAGQEYTISYEVSLAEKSCYATSGFGAYFTDGQFQQKNNSRLNVSPNVSTSNVIKDMNGWIKIEGNYTATGNEKEIIIGVFDKNFSYEKVTPANTNNTKRAYYYVKGIQINEFVKPDRDKDGIADVDDVCPDNFGTANFKGCPDSDNDGIVDSKDNCPNVAGLESFMGCPDSDNDGITDLEDKCPNIKGIKNNKGCPAVEVTEETKKVFALALKGIQFESGKDVIKKTSYTILDNVYAVLDKNKDMNVDINGHTDDQGDDKGNQILSEKRAIAVKKYLSDKGIASDRMNAKGFGESLPIESNKTAEGRALNRRVEFKVNNIAN